jgi:hypothetical protein
MKTLKKTWPFFVLALVVVLLGVARGAYNPSPGGTTITASRTTLSGTHTLTSSSAQLQFLDPNGSNRTVSLPTAATSLFFTVKNIASVGGGKYLIVRDASSILVDVIGPQEEFTYTYEGTAWQSSRKLTQYLGWWDAGQLTYSDTGGTTAASADGTNIGSWKSKVSNSATGTQLLAASAATTYPVVKTNIVNSLPVIRCSGSSREYRFNASEWPLGWTWIAVTARSWTTATNHRALLGQDLASDTVGHVWFWSNDGGNDRAAQGNMIAYTDGYSTGRPSRALFATSSFTGSAFHILSASLGKEAQARVDGVRQSYAVAGNFVASGYPYPGSANGAVPLCIGAADYSNTWPWDGDIAELIMLRDSAPDSEIVYYTILMSDKYGISVTP